MSVWEWQEMTWGEKGKKQVHVIQVVSIQINLIYSEITQIKYKTENTGCYVI